MNLKNTCFCITLLFFACSLFAQEETEKKNWLGKLEEDLKLKPSVNLQMWAVYSDRMEVYDQDKMAYEEVDSRLNFMLYRSRYGINMQPYKNLTFNFTVAADFVGRDALSPLDAGQNNGANPFFRLWQTFLRLKLNPEKETAVLTGGYFSPRIGRESLTNPLKSTSMEKAWSQNYLRRHLVGTGPGRAGGMNFGGLFYEEGRKVSFQYDIGLFSPIYQSVGGNSTGVQSSPLATGRLLFMFGEPESKKYMGGHKPNHFGKRKGVSVCIEGAAQGNTDLFSNSLTYGMNLLVNLGQLNVDADWHFLSRETTVESIRSNANTGYVRVSYNCPLKNGRILETAATYVKYNGEMELGGQLAAAAVGMPAGEDEHIDLGLNLYFNPNLKLALHYTLRDGDAGALGDGSTINNFFNSGAGAVRYGNWLGFGISAAF